MGCGTTSRARVRNPRPDAGVRASSPHSGMLLRQDRLLVCSGGMGARGTDGYLRPRLYPERKPRHSPSCMDHRAPSSCARRRASCVPDCRPPTQGTAGLVAHPAPGEFQRQAAQQRRACFADPLLASAIATRLRGGRQAHDPSAFPTIPKAAPTEQLQALAPDWPEPNEWQGAEPLTPGSLS